MTEARAKALEVRQRLKKLIHDMTYDELLDSLRGLIPRKNSQQPMKKVAKVALDKLSPNSVRARIAGYLRPVIQEHGLDAVATPAGGLKSGPLRDAYIAWYLVARKAELNRDGKRMDDDKIKSLGIIQARETIRSGHIV